MFVLKFKMAAAAILNYNFVMLDHLQSPFVHLKFPFKFCVYRVVLFEISRFENFANLALSAYLGPPKSCFSRVLTPKHYFFIIKTHKQGYLTRKHAF